ncbi:MAG: diguanylate cyclase [Phycisphaerales bacterium]|nr:diguanylate cyclase [Planctomycetota bacterium]MCH8509813.1 diguanylate cyclase [Phycisphaerales bacterium]
MNPVDPSMINDQDPLVLVVDDCEFVHRLLHARLRSESIRIESLLHGTEAVEHAIRSVPALILLDLNMPEMDGFEILRRLKDEPKTIHIPVIVLSGQDSAEDKVTAFDLGAVDFISKPFDMTELRARIRVALRMQALLQMLAQRAQIDGLTGLCNRASFDARWQQEHERASRSGSSLSLAMFDLDEFKSINDTYGHPAGDAVLVGLAQLINKTVRVSDVACRYGGEEFAIIFPETSPSEANAICERLRVACEQIIWPKHPGRAVTLSIGIAGTNCAQGLPGAQWIETADRNLYAAKRAGRNRIVMTDLGTGNLRVAS